MLILSVDLYIETIVKKFIEPEFGKKVADIWFKVTAYYLNVLTTKFKVFKNFKIFLKISGTF